MLFPFVFVMWPLLELTLLIKAAAYIGVGNVLLIIIGTGVFGGYLAKIQGFLVIQKIQDDLRQGVEPNTAMLDGFLVLLGGFALILPGLITDCLGVILLIPPCRWLIRKALAWKVQDMVKNSQVITIKGFERRQGYYDVDARVKDVDALPLGADDKEN